MKLFNLLLLTLTISFTSFAQEFKDMPEVTVSVFADNKEVKDGDMLDALPAAIKLGITDSSASYIFTWTVNLVRNKKILVTEHYNSREAKLMRILPYAKGGGSLTILIDKVSRRNNKDKSIEPVKVLNKVIKLNLAN